MTVNQRLEIHAEKVRTGEIKGVYKESKEIQPEQVRKQLESLQAIINPKPPIEERERRINELIAAREKKVSGPSEIK
jgi:hypothetical protein